MSTRVLLKRSNSRRRLLEGSNIRCKMVRDLDLNCYPDGSSSPNDADPLPMMPQLPLPRLPQPDAASRALSIGDQAIVIPDEDDDVVLLSSSSTIPSQVTAAPIIPVILIDEDSDVQQSHSHSGVTVQEPVNGFALYDYITPEWNPHKRLIINCEEYETRNYFAPTKIMETVRVQEIEPPPPPSPPKEPVFNCSVCLGDLDEATSTICGHIFCQKCIKAAVQAQKKCPTCRRHLTAKNIHRVYLPTTK